MNEAIQKLIEFLQSASPVVWAALIRQVYVESAGKFIWSLGLLVLCYVLFRAGKWAYSQYQEDEFSMYDIATWTFFIFSGAVGIAAFGLLVSGIMWLLNPQFYAIRFILSSLTP